MHWQSFVLTDAVCSVLIELTYMFPPKLWHHLEIHTHAHTPTGTCFPISSPWRERWSQEQCKLGKMFRKVAFPTGTSQRQLRVSTLSICLCMHVRVTVVALAFVGVWMQIGQLVHVRVHPCFFPCPACDFFVETLKKRVCMLWNTGGNWGHVSVRPHQLATRQAWLAANWTTGTDEEKRHLEEKEKKICQENVLAKGRYWPVCRLSSDACQREVTSLILHFLFEKHDSEPCIYLAKRKENLKHFYVLKPQTNTVCLMRSLHGRFMRHKHEKRNDLGFLNAGEYS